MDTKSPVAIGSITYPEVARRRERRSCVPRPGKEASSYPETHGQLVYAQAILTPDLPYQLLDFPQDDSGFPNDSTGDQFFNAGQFDAYQALGQCIGRKAAALDGNPSSQPSKQLRPHRTLRFPRLRR